MRTIRSALHRPYHWIGLATVFQIVIALVLVPVTSHPYDLSVLTGNAEAWLRWGVSPFYQWKFGLDYALLTVLAQTLRAFLALFGTPGVAAIHVAWKLPLVAANVLSAAYFYRLGLRFRPQSALLLACLWLINPVVLWVSAGHGQVESIAILSLLAALDLALSGHLLLAGFVTGLGAGFEYFPIVAVVVIFIWRRAGLLPQRRPVLVYSLGLVIALLACFGPLLLDTVARAGLVGGLVSSGGLDQNPALSSLSIWAWLGPDQSRLWPWLFLATAVVFFLVFARSRTGRAGIVVATGLLILGLVWDANTLPQFAAVAALCLGLLALVSDVEPVLLLGVPAAGLATYFFLLDGGKSDVNAFFFDEWWKTGSQLWHIPQSAFFSGYLGRVFVAELLVTYALGVLGAFRTPRVSGRLAVSLGVTTSLTLGIWAAQPAIWRALPDSPPSSDLPAFDSTSATRLGSIRVVAPGKLEITYPKALLIASARARIKPTGGLRVLVPQSGRRIGGLSATFNGHPVLLTYQFAAGDNSYAVGLPPTDGTLVFDSPVFPVQVTAAVLRWPTGSSAWLTNWLLRILGLIYGLALVATSFWGFRRLIAQTPSGQLKPSLRLGPRTAAVALQET
jgi:hypothetical protein